MLSSEHISCRYTDLDTWCDEDILTGLWQAQLDAVATIKAAIPSIQQAVVESIRRLECGGRLIYAGAGSSGALACLDAFELRGTLPGRMKD